MLEGPAWDARLADVAADVVRDFEQNREEAGEWLLVLRGRWEQVVFTVSLTGVLRQSSGS